MKRIIIALLALAFLSSCAGTKAFVRNTVTKIGSNMNSNAAAVDERRTNSYAKH